MQYLSADVASPTTRTIQLLINPTTWELKSKKKAERVSR